MAGLVRQLEQRTSKLLESLDERASVKISESRTQGHDASSLLGGSLMAAMQAPAAAGEEGEGSAYLKTPIRPGDRSTASATPATSLPRAHAGEQGEDTGPGQRQEQLALLMRDLQVVLQHGKAMQARLQREGMSRQALALQVRDLERALDDAANARADREEQLLAQIAELEAHVASVREQAGRDDNQRRVQGEEVKALESRVAEHAASAAAAGAEVERLRQTIGQHTSALSALRDEADATERELAALQAARAERERQFGAREAALDSRVAELSEALSQSVRSAEAKGAEASRLSAQLAGALTEASRANAAREAAEASAKELRAALEAADSMPPASRSAPDPAALAAQLDSTRAELGARDEQVRALSAELEAARAEQQQRRDADSEPGSGGAGEPASAERERELRAQLERTAAELSSQSTLVQQLRSECAALRLELEAETNRRRMAEQPPTERYQRKARAGSSYDLEAADEVGSYSPAKMQLTRRWAHRPNVAKVMTVVDEAAAIIDRGSIQTTRFLSHHPYVRLFFACYVLLLHLWVMVVLMHMAPGGRRGLQHAHRLHAHGPMPVGSHELPAHNLVPPAPSG